MFFCGQVSHCDFEKPDACELPGLEWRRTRREQRLPSLGLYYTRLARFSSSPEQQNLLKLPYYEFEQGQSVCLSFSYKLVGADSHLNVYVLKDDYMRQVAWSSKFESSVGTSAKFDSSWSRGFVDIFNNEGFQLYSTFQVIFEAFSEGNQSRKIPIGTFQGATVELDEINLSRTFCSAFR